MSTGENFHSGDQCVALVLHAYQPHMISDEGLKDIVDTSYRPLLLIHEKLGIPLTLNLQGCLLERLSRLTPYFMEKVKLLNRRGLIELTASAYYHPLLPLISRRSRTRQIQKNIEIHEELFGARPEGFWPPELAWNPAATGELVRVGIKWVVIDGSALVRAWSLGSLGNRQSNGLVLSGELTQPYNLEMPGGSLGRIVAVPRHHLLSDILFDGNALLSDASMESFLAKFLETGPGLICLAGDAERVSPGTERRYEMVLQALLVKGAKFLTVSEGIEQFQIIETVFVPAWTWQGSLGNWVRGEEERSYLRELSSAWNRYIAMGDDPKCRHIVVQVEEALLKAESSCCLFWNGPFAFSRDGYFQIEFAWQLMEGI